DPAVAVESTSGHCVDAVGVDDIRAYGDRRTAGNVDRSRGFFGQIAFDVSDDERNPLARAPQSDGPANAPSSAGDEDDLPGQSSRRWSLDRGHAGLPMYRPVPGLARICRSRAITMPRHMMKSTTPVTVRPA